jgi:3'(2'), 5'-bisphosphate nucleotidase
MPYQQELDVALEAARLAGRVILDLYARFREIPDARAEISTEADHRSQQTILEHLHQAFPADALCAEETTAQLSGVPRIGPRLWVVDPIDGTRGFARKNGEFSIMIGLVVQGAATVGVVYEPALKRLTYALGGRGCYRLDGTATQPTPCRVSAVAELERATLVQSHSRQGAGPSAYVQTLRPARVIETYSAGIKLAQVARGEADYYLNTYPAFHDWDVCAGQVLVDEAGGRVTGLGGQEVHYGRPGARHAFGLLASNRRLHADLLERLRSVPPPADDGVRAS